MSEKAWNTCPWCGQVVDVDEAHDGSEVRCLGCRRVSVVVATVGETWALDKRWTGAEEDALEDAAREALFMLLERLGGDGVTHRLRGDSSDELSTALVEHVRWLEQRARTEELFDLLKTVRREQTARAVPGSDEPEEIEKFRAALRVEIEDGALARAALATSTPRRVREALDRGQDELHRRTNADEADDDDIPEDYWVRMLRAEVSRAAQKATTSYNYDAIAWRSGRPRVDLEEALACEEMAIARLIGRAVPRRAGPWVDLGERRWQRVRGTTCIAKVYPRRGGGVAWYSVVDGYDDLHEASTSEEAMGAADAALTAAGYIIDRSAR